MTASTTPITIRAAAKKHWCSWCGYPIDQGDSYVKWRVFDQGDAGTVKVHPECHEAIQESEVEEWTPGDHTRGCTCDAGEDDCSRCERRMKEARDEARIDNEQHRRLTA